MVLTPGPGEPQGVLAIVEHSIDQLKQLITQLTHLTWFLGSELVADVKAKNKNQDTLRLSIYSM